MCEIWCHSSHNSATCDTDCDDSRVPCNLPWAPYFVAYRGIVRYNVGKTWKKEQWNMYSLMCNCSLFFGERHTCEQCVHWTLKLNNKTDILFYGYNKKSVLQQSGIYSLTSIMIKDRSNAPINKKLLLIAMRMHRNYQKTTRTMPSVYNNTISRALNIPKFIFIYFDIDFHHNIVAIRT